ncbi:MFS general substrate transporter [Westerdykella ornata]|uniref:MFS general substrate transporter n=1 Tax=Westerdykella ornata TaxID=318751 RepID=A0A6A6J943_WESOR|nr:MFS general substrate transporter [Westerdykella ornata]KAF2272797.1 MFS general substrate transporter [Westerdykella ornata]
MSRSQRSSFNSSSEDLGAAQFITNLLPHQLQHLQFSVPEKDEPEQFLERPRQVPVPKRFTIDPLDLARLKEGANQHTRKASLISWLSRNGSDDGSGSRISVDWLKEVERAAAEKVNGLDWKFHATGAALFILNLVVAWDATTLPIALPTIATTLKGGVLETFWVGVSFLVAVTCSLPLFAALSHVFGRKPILLATLTVFALGSLIAAVTGSFTGLLLGRTLQGIGAGSIYPLSNLIVSDLITHADRKKWSGILGVAWVIGAVSGPVIGGFLAQSEQWRWIFWLNLPCSIVVFILLAFCARLRPAAAGALLPKLRNVDWFGFVLLSGSLIVALLGLTWAGPLHPWASVRTILPIQFGVFGILIFLVWSWYSPCKSLVCLEGSWEPTKLATYFGAMIQGIIVSAALYFLPLYFDVAKRSYTFVEIGIALFAWSVSLAILAAISFFAASGTSLRRGLIRFGWFLVVLGTALMTVLKRESGTIMWICIAVFSAFGMGILYPTISAIALSTSRCEDDETAVVNFAFFQTLGQTLGVAIGASIFQNELYKQLLKKTLPERIAYRYVKNAFPLVTIVRDLTTEDELKTQVADAYIAAIRVIWVVSAVLAGAAMLAGFFVRRPHPRKSKEGEAAAKELG